MNDPLLMADALFEAVTGQRIEPEIVRERCPQCGGRGFFERPHAVNAPVVQFDYCTACASMGYIAREATR